MSAAILITALALAAIVLMKLRLLASTAGGGAASRLEQELGRAVRFDDAELSVLGGLGIRLRNLRIADDPSFSREDFVLADELRLHLALYPALLGRYQVIAVAVDKPKLNLIWDHDGFNADSLGRALQSAHVAKLEIRDGEIHFIRRGEPQPTDLTLRRVDASALDVGVEAPFRVRLKAALFDAGEPNLDLDGTLGPLGPSPSIATTPIDVGGQLGPLTLEQARTISPISRLLPDALTSPGALTLRGKLKGAAESLEVAAQGDLGGFPFALEAQVHASTERAVEFVATSGEAKAEARGSIRFAEDPPKLTARLSSAEGAWQGVGYRDLKAEIEHSSPLMTVQKFSFRAFDGLWGGSGKYDAKPPGSFSAQTSVSDVTLSRVLAVRVADPPIEGHLSADLMLEGAGGPSAATEKAVRGDGYFEVKDGTLKIIDLLDQVLKATVAVSGFTHFVPENLRAKYARLFSPQGAPFERLAGTIHVSEGRLHCDDLALSARDYAVNGAGTALFRGDVEFRGRLLASRELTDDAIASFGKGKSLVNSEGRLELPFHVAGAFPSLRAELDADVVQEVLGRRARQADASAGAPAD